MEGTRYKGLKAITFDIAEGYVAVNPLFLKPFNEEALKSLYRAVERKQTEIRIAPFPYNEPTLIRKRNLRLQRLYTALVVIKNLVREKNYSNF